MRAFIIATTALWVVGISLIVYTFARAATFGTDTFGTGLFGTGTTTTSTYIPGRERNNIIGGGIVMLRPEDVKSNPWNNNVRYSIEYSKNLISKEDKG